jgi:hypothetical protein
MKKIIIYIKYALYFILTLEDRNRYMTGKVRGYHCTKIENGTFSSRMTYEKRPPEREYLTWKEFKESHKKS